MTNRETTIMNILDYRNQNINSESFFKLINDARKSNKNQWYGFVGVVEGREVSIKGYNTWLQVYKVNGIDHSSCMDITVSRFKYDLASPFKQQEA